MLGNIEGTPVSHALPSWMPQGGVKAQLNLPAWLVGLDSLPQEMDYLARGASIPRHPSALELVAGGKPCPLSQASGGE